MKNKSLIYIVIVVPVIIAIVYCIVKWYTSPGEYDEFAQCLSEKGVKMYGTDWCSYCQLQKKKFGKSFKYIDFINCDTNKAECDDAGVKGYPTWIINNQIYSGSQSLEILSTLTECQL